MYEASCRMWRGRAFQRDGPMCEKDRVPQVWCVRGMWSRLVFDERSCLGGEWCCIRSCMYVGALLWRDWCTRRRILKLMRACTGSQWSSLSIGEMCDVLLLRVTSLAAEFWRYCRRLSWYSGRLISMELQKSNLEEISECTTCSVDLRDRNFRMCERLRSWYLTDLATQS